MSSRIKSKKIALLGILGAQALALSFLEGLLPALPGLPPGAKPGFSNIVTMFTAYSMGFRHAVLITLIKAAYAALTRGPTAFFMSLSGGLLSTVVMCLLIKQKKQRFGLIGISVASAIAHNAGQLIVAMLLTGSEAIIGYAPLLTLFALVTGIITGAILKAVIPALIRQSKYFS
jgi:heptaprenyl diphosphate synthase